jgi:hypothetical protein
LTLQYTVTRWPDNPSIATQQATITIPITAANHLKALELSGLKEPGALISVNRLGGTNIRYQVDSSDRVSEVYEIKHKEVISEDGE